MSSERGNSSRTRAQKHQNTRVFKNNLHDKSKKTQIINSTQILNTCNRCKSIIEWKIKYKKYKQLKTAKTCIKCLNKTVKQSYHTICALCIQQLKVCGKCGTKDLNNSVELISPNPSTTNVSQGTDNVESSDQEFDDSDSS